MIIIHLKKNSASYRFFCVRYKSVEITEATVRYLFEDDESQKTYLVFSTARRPSEYVLREYEGEPHEQRFWRVSDTEIHRKVYELLKHTQENSQGQRCGERIMLCV